MLVTGRTIHQRLEQGIAAEHLGIVAIGVSGENLVDLLREDGLTAMDHELLGTRVWQTLGDLG